MARKVHEHIFVHSEFNKLPRFLIFLYIILPLFGLWYFLAFGMPGMSMTISQADTAAARGKRIAAEQGCFNCHGPEGRGGIENPTHPDLKVPAWSGEDMAPNNMYYPIVLRQEIEHAVIRTMYDDAGDIGGQEFAAIKMQPWIGRLTAAQIRDIMAYIYSINPDLQQKMRSILQHKPDKDIQPFEEASGDINPAFPKSPEVAATTRSGLVMGTPATQQMPGRTDYPDTYDDYTAARASDKTPQYYYDIREFADLIGLKY